jgi:hypothetical protein
MEAAEIYAKTELGVRELKERTVNLPLPLRGLLIMVDGNRTIGDVLAKARMLNLDETALSTLETGGLIAKKFSAPSASTNGAAAAPVRSEDEVERYLRAQQLMSDATNKHMGFRGYGMMMRLQKTANIRDLRDLLPDFAGSLLKRAGAEVATPIVAEVEAILLQASG